MFAAQDNERFFPIGRYIFCIRASVKDANAVCEIGWAMGLGHCAGLLANFIFGGWAEKLVDPVSQRCGTVVLQGCEKVVAEIGVGAMGCFGSDENKSLDSVGSLPGHLQRT